MKTLHGYVLREHASPLAFSLGILVSILLMNQVVLLFDKLVGKGLQSSVILEVLGLCIPFIFATTMPMAVLVSTLWAFGRLSSDNEIVAMKASGISLLSVLRPPLLAAFLLALLMTWFNNSILPETNFLLRSILLDISYQKPTIEIKEGVLMDDLSGYSLLVQRIDRQNSRLHDVTIYDSSSDGAPRTILAEEGEMSFSDDRENLILKLKDGEIHLVDPDNMRNYERVAFKTQTIIIKNIGGEFQRREHGTYRTDREMSSSMMIEEVRDNRARIASAIEATNSRWRSAVDTLFTPSLSQDGNPGVADAAAASSSPVELALQGIRQNIIMSQKKEKEIEALEKRNDQLMVEVHKKYSIPFASIVFILLGVPLRLKFRAGGAGTVIVLSLIIFTGYYIFLTGGENLADRGLIHPALAMWAPNVFFGTIGVGLLFKTTREASSSALSVLNPRAWLREKKEVTTSERS